MTEEEIQLINSVRDTLEMIEVRGMSNLNHMLACMFALDNLLKRPDSDSGGDDPIDCE